MKTKVWEEYVVQYKDFSDGAWVDSGHKRPKSLVDAIHICRDYEMPTPSVRIIKRVITEEIILRGDEI